MPTELPEGLQKALEIIGGQRWPEGDEDGLRRMSAAWADISTALDTLDAAVERSANDIATTMRGEFSDAYGRYTAEKLRPMLQELRTEVDKHSSLAKNTAADIQYAKISIIVQLVIVAATLAFQWLPGIGQAITAAAAATARAVIMAIFRTVLQNIIAGAVIGTAIGAGLDAVIQGMQMLTGVRTDWNENFTKGAVIGGALGGAMGGAVGGAFRGVGNFARGGIGDVAGEGIENITNKVVRGPAAEGAEGILGQGAKNFLDTTGGKLTHDVGQAVGQGAAGLAADGATNAALGQEEWNPFAFSSAMVGGFDRRGDGGSPYGGGEGGGADTGVLNGLKGFDGSDTDLPDGADLPKTTSSPDGTYAENTSGDGVRTESSGQTGGSTGTQGSSGRQDGTGTVTGDGRASPVTGDSSGTNGSTGTDTRNDGNAETDTDANRANTTDGDRGQGETKTADRTTGTGTGAQDGRTSPETGDTVGGGTPGQNDTDQNNASPTNTTGGNTNSGSDETTGDTSPNGIGQNGNTGTGTHDKHEAGNTPGDDTTEQSATGQNDTGRTTTTGAPPPETTTTPNNGSDDQTGVPQGSGSPDGTTVADDGDTTGTVTPNSSDSAPTEVASAPPRAEATGNAPGHTDIDSGAVQEHGGSQSFVPRPVDEGSGRGDGEESTQVPRQHGTSDGPTPQSSTADHSGGTGTGSTHVPGITHQASPTPEVTDSAPSSPGTSTDQDTGSGTGSGHAPPRTDIGTPSPEQTNGSRFHDNGNTTSPGTDSGSGTSNTGVPPIAPVSVGQGTSGTPGASGTPGTNQVTPGTSTSNTSSAPNANGTANSSNARQTSGGAPNTTTSKPSAINTESAPRNTPTKSAPGSGPTTTSRGTPDIPPPKQATPSTGEHATARPGNSDTNPVEHTESSAPPRPHDTAGQPGPTPELGPNQEHRAGPTLHHSNGIQSTPLTGLNGYHGVKSDHYNAVLDQIQRPTTGTAGNEDPNWKGWYLGEVPDHAAGYALNDMGHGGAVLEFSLPHDVTVHTIPTELSTDVPALKQHFGIDDNTPLLDGLAEQNSILRIPENPDGDHELIVPWKLAQSGNARHHSYVDDMGTVTDDKPRGWDRRVPGHRPGDPHGESSAPRPKDPVSRDQDSATPTTHRNQDGGNRLTSPAEWGDRRDTAVPTHHRSERFDPAANPRIGGGRIQGAMTRIDYDVRRFEVEPGNWVREFTVKLDLVSPDEAVSPQARRELGERVRSGIDDHFNQRHRLPGSGDQLHINVEFDTPPWNSTRHRTWMDEPEQNPSVRVHDSTPAGLEGPTQMSWATDHPTGPLTHEIMHYLGLGEGYRDTDLLLRHPDQPGVMGKGAWDAHPFLTQDNLHTLENIVDTGPVIRDHPLTDPDTDPPRHGDDDSPHNEEIHGHGDKDTTPAERSESNAPPRKPMIDSGSDHFRQAQQRNSITPVGEGVIVGPALGNRAPGQDGPGFVATVAATPGTNLFDLATKYEQGFSGPESSRGRFGLSIGVNGNGHDNDSEISRMIEDFAQKWSREGTFPVAIHGFTWDHPNVRWDDSGRIDQKSVPYGAIRETIARHPNTEDLLRQVRGAGQGNEVYLHTGDADVHSLTTDNGPLFEAISTKHSGMEHPPEVISGGYKVPDSDGPMAAGAARLDLDVRHAMAEIDPRSVYFPEPNTFVRISAETGGGLEKDITFGTRNDNSKGYGYGAKEGQGLLDSVLAQRGHGWGYSEDTEPNRMVRFDSDAAITTDGGRIATKLAAADPHQHLDRLLELTQSHANKTGWSDQVEHYIRTHHPHLSPNAAKNLANLAFQDIPSANGAVPTRQDARHLSIGWSPEDRKVFGDLKRKDPEVWKHLRDMAVNTRNALIDGLNRESEHLDTTVMHGESSAPPRPSDRAVDGAHHRPAPEREHIELETIPEEPETQVASRGPQSATALTDSASQRDGTLDRARQDRPKVVGEFDGKSVREAVSDLLDSHRGLREDPKTGEFAEVALSDKNLRENFHRILDGGYVVDFADRAGNRAAEVVVELTGLSEQVNGSGRDGVTDFGAEQHRSVQHSSSTARNPVSTGSFSSRIPTPHFLAQLQVLGLVNSRESSLSSETSHSATTKLTESGVVSRTTGHNAAYKITVRTPGRLPWSSTVSRTDSADGRVELAWPQREHATANPESEVSMRHIPPETIEHAEFSGLGDVYRAVTDELGVKVNDPGARELRDWLHSLDKDLLTGVVRESFAFGGRRHPTEIVLGVADDLRVHRVPDVEGTVEHTGTSTAKSTLTQSNTRERGGELWLAGGDISGVSGALAGPSVGHSRSTRNESSTTEQHQRRSVETHEGPLTKHRLDLKYLVQVGNQQREVNDGPTHDDGHRDIASESVAGPGTKPVDPAKVTRYEPKRLLEVDGSATLWSTRHRTEHQEPAPEPAGTDRHWFPDHIDARHRIPEETVQGITGPVLSRLHAEGQLPADELPRIAEKFGDFVRDHARDITSGDGVRFPLSALHGGAPDVFVRGDMNRSDAQYLGSPQERTLGGAVGATHEHTSERTHDKSTSVGVSAAAAVSIPGAPAPSQYNNYPELHAKREISHSHGERTSQQVGHERSLDSAGRIHEFRYPTEFEVRIAGRWSKQTGTADRHGPDGTESTHKLHGNVQVAATERAGIRLEDSAPPRQSETGDAWQRGNAPRPQRTGHLPAGFELASLRPVPGLLTTMTEMLNAAPGARKRRWAALPFVGDRPARFDEHHGHGLLTPRRNKHHDALDEHNTALDAVEAFASNDARTARFEQTALYQDTARLRSHNDGGLFGNRELTAWAEMSTKLGAPRVVARDDDHGFGGGEKHASTELDSDTRKNTSAKLGVDITHYFQPASPVLLGPTASASAKYTDSDANTGKFGSAKNTSSSGHTERGYLVHFDAAHQVRTSVRHTWQDPLRMLHRSTPAEETKWVRVPDAVAVWVPAGEIHQVGELAEADIAKLDPADADRYRQQTRSDDEPHAPTTPSEQQAGSQPVAHPPADPADSEVRPPENVGRGSGSVELYRLNTGRELLEGIGQRLDQWSREHGRLKTSAKLIDVAYQALGKPVPHRQPRAAKFDAVNERLVRDVLGPIASRHGFDAALGEMLNGGRPMYLEGETPFGKVEQLVVLHARTGEGQYHRTLSEHTATDNHETTSRDSHSDRKGWDVDGGFGVAAYYGTGEYPASLQRLGLTGGYTDKRGFESTTESGNTVSTTTRGTSVQFLHDLTIDMEVYPYARPGTYSSPLAELAPALAPRRFGEPWRESFALPGAARSTVDAQETVPAHGPAPQPLEEVSGSLREHQSTQQAELGWPQDAKIQVRPFAAPRLRAELDKLIHGDPTTQPPRPGLHPWAASRLHAATNVNQLRSHLRRATSENGYSVPLASDHLAGVRITADLTSRELIRTIHRGTLSRTTTDKQQLTPTSQREGRLDLSTSLDFREPAIQDAPMRTNQALVDVTKTVASRGEESKHTISTTEESPSKEAHGPRYLVRVTPEWNITPTYRAGKAPQEWSQSLRTGPDEPVLLEVDRDGLELLGLHEPEAEHTGETSATPPEREDRTDAQDPLQDWLLYEHELLDTDRTSRTDVERDTTTEDTRTDSEQQNSGSALADFLTPARAPQQSEADGTGRVR